MASSAALAARRARSRPGTPMWSTHAHMPITPTERVAPANAELEHRLPVPQRLCSSSYYFAPKHRSNSGTLNFPFILSDIFQAHAQAQYDPLAALTDTAAPAPAPPAAHAPTPAPAKATAALGRDLITLEQLNAHKVPLEGAHECLATECLFTSSA